MILVTGATGNVGREVVAALLAAGEPVRALSRRPDPPVPDRVEVAVGDVDDPGTLPAALSGVDGVFLLAGFADMPGALAAMAGAGVRRVALLSAGAVPGDPDNAVVAMNTASETAVHASGLEWTVLRPSGFLSNALRWSDQLAAGDEVTEPFGEVRVASIDPADIGAVAALALTSPGQAGATYRLTGPESLLPADRVRILGEVLGRPLRFVPKTAEEDVAAVNASMPKPYADAMLSFFRDGTYDDSKVLPTVEDLLGRLPRDARQWSEAHAEEFRTPPR